MFKRSKNICTPHGFSTRNGGVSCGDYSSLNLGFSYGDKPECVSKNWEIFSDSCRINVSHLAAATQVHKADVAIVNRDACLPAKQYALNTPNAQSAEDYCPSENADPLHCENAANHICKFKPLCQVDGLVTADKGVSLVIFTADCASLLLHDSDAHVSAALHCGWKSFTSDIIAYGLQAMRILSAKPANIKATIGPCIHKCCFEVGNEVTGAFDALLGDEAKKFYKKSQTQDDKYFADLPGAVAQRLIQLGVWRDNIEIIDECTTCSSDTFFSYRAENGHTGRLASVIENV